MHPDQVSQFLSSKLKMSSDQVVNCIYLLTLLTDVSIEANSVDPGQTTPTGAF